MVYIVQSNISCMPIMYLILVCTQYSTFLCIEYEALMFGMKVHLIAHCVPVPAQKQRSDRRHSLMLRAGYSRLHKWSSWALAWECTTSRSFGQYEVCELRTWLFALKPRFAHLVCTHVHDIATRTVYRVLFTCEQSHSSRALELLNFPLLRVYWLVSQ